MSETAEITENAKMPFSVAHPTLTIVGKGLGVLGIITAVTLVIIYVVVPAVTKDKGPTPVDCEVSDWTNDPGQVCYSSQICGDGEEGTIAQTRTIITQPAHGGVACPELTRNTTCDLPSCNPIGPELFYLKNLRSNDFFYVIQYETINIDGEDVTMYILSSEKTQINPSITDKTPVPFTFVNGYLYAYGDTNMTISSLPSSVGPSAPRIGFTIGNKRNTPIQFEIVDGTQGKHFKVVGQELYLFQTYFPPQNLYMSILPISTYGVGVKSQFVAYGIGV